MKRRSHPTKRTKGTYGAKLRGERGPMMYGPTKHRDTIHRVKVSSVPMQSDGVM